MKKTIILVLLLISVTFMGIFAATGDNLSVYGKVKVVGVYGNKLLVRLVNKDDDSIDIYNTCHAAGETGQNSWIYFKNDDIDKYNTLLSLAMYAQASGKNIRLNFIAGECVDKGQIIHDFTVF